MVDANDVLAKLASVSGVKQPNKKMFYINMENIIYNMQIKDH